MVQSGKVGRPALSENESTVRVNAKVTQSIKENIENLGGGNISLGVRLMMKMANFLHWSDRKKAPNVSTVYLAFDRECELLYVGQTISLANRLRIHHRASEFEKAKAIIMWMEMPEDILIEVESELITKLSPMLNRAPVQEPKRFAVTAVVERSVKATLQTIATNERVSVSHVVRDAIYAYIDALPRCQKCKGIEIKKRGRFDKGLCRTVTFFYCEDCGHEWEYRR